MKTCPPAIVIIAYINADVLPKPIAMNVVNGIKCLAEWLKIPSFSI
jgi:hypothetical protein